MAFITFSGFPCSGKSTRALQIKAEFERRLGAEDYAGPSYRVLIVDDETSNVSREAYDSSLAEKPARASLFANVTREMRNDTILLCDSLNYIKGFRYQMYCAAREATLRVCTIHVAAPPDKCREWHAARKPESQYKEPTFDNLIMRYEEPSSMVRWDSPLFTISWDDEQLPYDDLWKAVMEGMKKGPTGSVIPVVRPPPNTLQLLTTATSSMTSLLLPASQSSITVLPVPSIPGLVINLPSRTLTLSELQRLKRQYEAMQTKGLIQGGQGTGKQEWTLEDLTRGFVRFLEGVWGTSED